MSFSSFTQFVLVPMLRKLIKPWDLIYKKRYRVFPSLSRKESERLCKQGRFGSLTFIWLSNNVMTVNILIVSSFVVSKFRDQSLRPSEDSFYKNI